MAITKNKFAFNKKCTLTISKTFLISLGLTASASATATDAAVQKNSLRYGRINNFERKSE